MALNVGLVRKAAVVSNWLSWIGAIIVMAIASYFIRNWKYLDGEHLIYQEVIACIAVAFYIPSLFLPLIKAYRGYLLPLHFIFSYLWLTGFVFAAQDYNWHGCLFGDPAGLAQCSKKDTLEAFIFIAFFFTTLSLVLEALLWHALAFEVGAAAGASDKPATAPGVAPPVDAPV